AGAAELAKRVRSAAPDVVLTEATFADGSAVEACLDELVASGARVAVICDDPSPERLTGILARGACAYLRSDTSPLDLVDAVVDVAEGHTVLHPWATATVMDQWRRMRAGGGGGLGRTAGSALTAREAEVLAAMVDGLATKAIARRLGVAVKTVENHKIRIFDKLGVRTQAGAVALAISHGLLSDAAPPTQGRPETAPQGALGAVR
ncbi:MAG: response regulator transcription factor, partial [Acidimicrobiia bacterium]